LNDLKSSLTFCENCGNVDISSPCSICNSNKRKSEKVCVVEDIGDLWAIEKSKAYDGHYHVLGGVLSAIDGIGPDELNISSAPAIVIDAPVVNPCCTIVTSIVPEPCAVLNGS
jgi:recombination protein RecR